MPRNLLSIGLFVFYAVIAVCITTKRMPPTGDEPHYLITAHSVAVEGDISLKENYLNRDYKIFYPGLLTKRTTFAPDRSYELPAFGPGLAFFLAPFYWVSFHFFQELLVPFLRVVMCGIAAFGIYNLLACVEGFNPDRRQYALPLIAAISSPLLTYSSMFYPEMLAFLLAVIAMRCYQRMRERTTSSVLVLSLIPAALLWIHPKYLALATLVALLTTILLWRDTNTLRGIRIIHLALTLAGILSFFWFLHAVYGSWSPNRVYGGAQREMSLFELLTKEGFDRIWVMLRMLPGYFLDQRFGVIVYAPIYLAFFPALLWTIRRYKFEIAPLTVLFLSHYLLLSWGAQMGGYAPPSRHFVVILPFLIIPIALVSIHWNLVQKIFFSVLVVFSITISILILSNYRSIFTNATWRNPDGHSEFFQWLGLQNAIPRFTSSPPDFLLAVVWILAVVAAGFLLYPRKQQLST